MPNIGLMFMAEHKADIDALRVYKYSTIYAYMSSTDLDPIKSKPVTCDVLYFGDNASSKLDQLKLVVIVYRINRGKQLC